MKNSLRYRQVHLDFHTSEQIKGIGSKFSKKQFQSMLKAGHVDSITVFSKCHHGMSYHPTKVGVMHPYLDFDLLGAQIEAAHEIGVNTPVYLSSGLDEYYVKRNPGHMSMVATGYNPLHAGWKRLCTNTPYLDYLCRQIEEVVDNYDADGIFIDIVGIVPCVCQTCQREMFERGMDPENPNEVQQLGREVQARYLEKATASARKNSKKMRVFHNAGHIPKGDKTFIRFDSHLELESLPTGGWGYDHFPLSAKYCATIDNLEMLGMTGKFHTTWGEFGGFKHPNALRYECSAMLAYGARCSVGDQLHPNGAMNLDTYQRLGVAYAEVEEKEPYCIDARPVSQIAILSIESLRIGGVQAKHQADRSRKGDVGASRMMLERQMMFDVIDTEADFNRYKIIVIPDDGRLPSPVARKLQTFVRKGGKLVLSYQSGMKGDSDEFWFDVGEASGISESDPEYIKVRKTLLDQDKGGRLVKTPFVLPGKSMQVKAEGAEILADTYLPYFNRTLEHFCSHQHAPDARKSRFPAALIKGNILYFSHAIFTAYADRGQMLYRDLFYEALSHFAGAPDVRTTLPSAGRVSLMEQSGKNRYILHLLYATPIKRGDAVKPEFNIQNVEVIEDIVPLFNVSCEIDLPRKIKSIKLAPEGDSLDFEQTGNSVTFTVPKLECHQMITLQY